MIDTPSHVLFPWLHGISDDGAKGRDMAAFFGYADPLFCSAENKPSLVMRRLSSLRLTEVSACSSPRLIHMTMPRSGRHPSERIRTGHISLSSFPRPLIVSRVNVLRQCLPHPNRTIHLGQPRVLHHPSLISRLNSRLQRLRSPRQTSRCTHANLNASFKK